MKVQSAMALRNSTPRVTGESLLIMDRQGRVIRGEIGRVDSVVPKARERRREPGVARRRAGPAGLGCRALPDLPPRKDQYGGMALQSCGDDLRTVYPKSDTIVFNR